MDRCHRLGQEKQVTVYRLVTMSTIEEKILKRAKEKHTVCTHLRYADASCTAFTTVA